MSISESAIELCERTDCLGCWSCVNRCPQNAISMQPDELDGFLYPVINSAKCVHCELCRQACPILKPKELSHYIPNESYACWNLDESVRKQSTSGGVHFALAQQILLQGGVVFGAVFDDSFVVKHQGLLTLDEAKKSMGSKYVQSSIEYSYREVKELLHQEIPVLFTGTPCQIAGLYSYLAEDHPLLWTVDLICGGTPSPLFFEKYLEYIEGKAGSKLSSYSFRSKKQNGWNRFILSCCATFQHDKDYTATSNADPAFISYLGKLTQRLCCYSCPYVKVPRQGDLTIADYWGVYNNTDFEYDTYNGVSLVLVNSDKGSELFKRLSSKLFINKRTFEQACENNPCLNERSIRANPLRNVFFRDLRKKKFSYIVRKYLTKQRPFIIRLLGKLKSVTAKFIARYS